MGDDSDNLEFFEDEVDDKTHKTLIENVLKLNKIQQVKTPVRTEPSIKVSEFNLVNSRNENRNVVHVNELTKALKDKRTLQISSKVKSTTSRSQVLPKPLEKPQAERIKRALNYEKSRLKLDRWEALVMANRAAPQLTFPLNSNEKVKILEKKAEIYPSTFRLKSNLQKKLEAIEPKVEEYHIDSQEKEEYPLTLDELKEKRREAAKLRVHQSFKEAKARRQNKIKSKKYHRILRKEKIKQKLKEFEELQKVNPEEALKKLEDIDKARAEERFSLRHKGASQWARNKQVRAKYDKESRRELANQLAISRDLTQKRKVDSESEDDCVVSGEHSRPINKSDENNPWINGVKPSREVADFVSGYRAYWNEKNKENTNSAAKDISGTLEINTSTSVSGTKNKSIDTNVSLHNSSEAPTKNGEVKLSVTQNKSKIDSKKKMKSFNVKKNTEIQKRSSLSTLEWEVSCIESTPEDIDTKEKPKQKKNKNNKIKSKISKSEKKLELEDMFQELEEQVQKKIDQKLTKIKCTTNSKKLQRNKPKTLEGKKVDLSFPKIKKKQVIDEAMLERAQDINENLSNPELATLKKILDSKTKEQEPVNINPEDIMKIKPTNLNTSIPDLLTADDNQEHDDQRNLIMEAFEDDDIMADFSKEKAEEIDKDTPKDIDLNLPGWGSWAGVGINSSKRKRRRFILKMPTQMPRKDDNKGFLIINEKAQAKIKPLLVSEIPFPFKSVKDYEASIRAPIGNTFVPEMAFRRYIEPSVVTKMGSIIEPINKGILIGVKNI